MVDLADMQRSGRIANAIADPSPAANLRVLGIGMSVGAAVLTVAPVDGIVRCPLRTVTGVPCPFCGMTTGTLAAARGDVIDSIAANPAAIVLLAAIAVAFVPQRGRERITRALSPPPPVFAWLALIPLWIWQLARFDLI